MKTTANLGLKKPEGTDVVNIEDFNYNADVIDTELQKRALKTDIPTVPVQSVNGKTGAVTLSAGDVGAATSAQGIKADTALQSSQLGKTGGPAKQDDLVSHLADNMYQPAGGTATAITLTISGTLVTGYPITFIASANNNSAATTINGKQFYKPGTTTAPTLIAGKAYTAWYNATSNCFFIKASAEGDAIAGNVLAGKKFSNDDDTGLVGTMTNRAGAKFQICGYEEITEVIPHPSAPNTQGLITGRNAYGATGYIDSNSQMQMSVNNLIPENIKKGVAIGRYGGSGSQVMIGTCDVESLGGKRYASGTGQVYGDGTFTYSGSYTGSRFSFAVTGLAFTPRVITIYATVTLKDSVGGNPYVIFNSWVKDPLTFPNGGKSTNITQMENSDMRLTADGFYWFSAITLNVDAITNPRYYFTNNSVTWHAWG
ncbi:hypothetical protein [Clostridium aciditolerans]|uniref:hypothetical protein n=1 Tax=Clostridium aciditolerans TaxID=339861 RepID=UPI001FE9063A|nr:hypothetical protein [Clostridium aciditolerans]